MLPERVTVLPGRFMRPPPLEADPPEIVTPSSASSASGPTWIIRNVLLPEIVPLRIVNALPPSLRIEGRPLAPFSLLFTAVRENVRPPRSISSTIPLVFASLMSAINPATSVGA